MRELIPAPQRLCRPRPRRSTHSALRAVSTALFFSWVQPILATDSIVASDAPVSPTLENASPAHAAQLRVLVLEAGTREPLEGIELRLSTHEGERYSDEAGWVTFDALPPGPTTLSLVSPGYLPLERSLLLAPGDRLELTLYLMPGGRRSPAMEVTTERTMPESTRYRLSAEASQDTPGTLGDPVKAVQNLPGVARSPYGLGTLIVRGTAPNESGYFIEDAEVPLLFHFLGLTSAVSSGLLEQLDYLPGGFGARYGRLVGGVVQLDLQDEFSSTLHGTLDLDLIDASVQLQQRLASGIHLAVAGRWSYLEKLLGPAITTVVTQSVRAAQYGDGQLRLGMPLGDHSWLTATALTSRDRFLVLNPPTDTAEDEPETLAEYASDFTRLQLSLKTRFNTGTPGLQSHRLLLAGGPNREYLYYASTRILYQPLQLSLRDEVEVLLSPTLFTRVGLDVQAIQHQFQIELPGDEGEIPEIQSGWTFSPSPYLELEWTPQPRWQIRPGLRLDPYWNPSQDFKAMSVDPRLSVRHRPSSELSFSASVGQYSQAPEPTEYFKTYGNNALKTYHALQTALGMEWRTPWAVELQASVYFHALRDLVYLPENAKIPIEQYLLGEVNLEDYIARPQNGAIGRSYGFEVLFTLPRMGALEGFLAYSFNNSVLKAPDDKVWSRFDYEQPHTLNAVLQLELPRRWMVGAHFRLSSGSPYTPAANRIQNLDTGGYSGLDDPARGNNWARLPPFQTLDVRVEREWRFTQWRLAASLEIQNIYNHRNVELVYATRDYSGVVPIYGLPILPVLGIRGTF